MQILQMLASLRIETKNVHYQSQPEELVCRTIDLQQGILSDSGALCVHTGRFTGRSPKDRFIVMDEITKNKVDWGEINIPFTSKTCDKLCDKVCSYLSQMNTLLTLSKKN